MQEHFTFFKVLARVEELNMICEMLGGAVTA